jgi:hypothetical protein
VDEEMEECELHDWTHEPQQFNKVQSQEIIQFLYSMVFTVRKKNSGRIIKVESHN